MNKCPAILGIFLIFLFSPAGASEVPPQARGPESHFVKSADGVQIHYWTMGEGTPIFFIHGYYAEAYYNWWPNGIAEALVDNFQIIAMDMRGHGKSDKPRLPSAYGQNMWKDVIAVMDDQNIPQAHFHGYSMGALLITQVLFHHPERVLSAIYGGMGVPEFDSVEIAKIEEDKEETKEIEEEEEKAKDQFVAETDPDHFALYMLSQNGPGRGPEHREIDLTKIDIPILGIVGEYDKPNRRFHRMQRQLPNFRKVIVPDKGHLTTITPGFMPSLYLEETLKFMEAFVSSVP